ncbi:MAG: cation diffusion facilitator family transporter [Acidobacteriota bacterium]
MTDDTPALLIKTSEAASPARHRNRATARHRDDRRPRDLDAVYLTRAASAVSDGDACADTAPFGHVEMSQTHIESGAARNRPKLQGALALTAAYCVTELVAGWRTGSLALLADAGHMLTDVAGLALALFAIQMAERPATPERTYGYYRTEILAALANAIVLVGVSIWVFVEAYERIRHPQSVATGAMALVALVGLGVNAGSIWLLRSASSESLNLKGAYFEVLSDAISSIGVLVAAAVMWLTGWNYADPIVSVAIGVFILPRTVRLMLDAVGVLLEGTPSDVSLGEVRSAIAAIRGVADVHDLHVWTLTSGVNAISVHVVANDPQSFGELLTRVDECATKHFKIAHVTVQVEPPGWHCHGMHT